MTRDGRKREMSRRTFAVVGAGAAATAAGVATTVAMVGRTKETFHPHQTDLPAQQPNMLVILADDLGWADLSCYGSPNIKTPNLDRLAESGLLFTDGYAASSVCSP